MKYIFLLLFTALIFTSCERSEPVAEVAYCSETRVNAPCENKEEKCYKGKCIALTSKCGGDTDAFCELGKECQKDDLTQNYSCVEGRCRKSNPDGYCVKENMVCIQGACSYPCSTEHPEGACEESAKSCFNGICIESNNQCGNNNPNGLCQENHKCAKEDDEEYKCLRICSKDFPGGPCLNDEQTCVEGVCLHRDNLCEDKENGECPTGKICLDKTCVYECSESSIDGKCKNDESFICVQGNCEERCSQTAPTGYCSGEYAGCQNGLCKKSCGTEEGEDIDGYCSNNYWCKEGVCTMPCDVDHKNGFCKDEDQWCNDGLCTNHCGQENGECQGENIICKDDGTCAEWCSSTYPAGECQENHVCQNNTCILATCGEQFPNGFCS